MRTREEKKAKQELRNRGWLYCCACSTEVQARLTNGAEIYPHRRDLHALPFWRHDVCGNYVGTHHKTVHPTRPLGCIPTKELKDARQKIHRILDPLWQGGHITRGRLYRRLSDELGFKYHTAAIKSVPEARMVNVLVQNIARELQHARSA